MLSEPLSHPDGLFPPQGPSPEPVDLITSDFSRAAQALLSHSERYFAVALTEGELITHWCSHERRDIDHDQEVSTVHVSALLPTLNLLIQTTPHSSASSVDIRGRVSYTYTYHGRARALHALTYGKGALVLITSSQSLSERAHFWLGFHYEELKRHALTSSVGGPLDHVESASVTSQR